MPRRTRPTSDFSDLVENVELPAQSDFSDLLEEAPVEEFGVAPPFDTPRPAPGIVSGGSFTPAPPRPVAARAAQRLPAMRQ